MIRAVTPALVVALCLLVAACSGSRESRDEPEPDPPRTDTPRTDAPRADPPRTDPPPSPPPEKAAPRPYTAQGFRIQILTTGEKNAADTQMAQAVAWWKDLPASRRPGGLGRGDLSIDVKWKQPYYRVRMGDFASRAEAQQALAAVKQQFPDAFVVPDTVTIWR